MVNTVYEFDRFELDLGGYDLRCAGKSVRLEKIPMELLIFLVERRGELVTRQQIVDRLWGKEVFLDTEQSVNTAIRKIRIALEDDADRPRLLQTIVGKGYRFIGEVSVAANGSGSAATTNGSAGTAAQIPKRKLSSRLLLATPVALFLVALGIFFAWRHHGSPPRSPIQSVAVLPLANLSGDPGQEYFADGFTDALITQLAKLQSVKVISRSSSMQYKSVQKPLPQIAQELKVDGIIEGSVSRSAGLVQVRAQLIDARSDYHLWADEYQRDLRDIRSLQGEVARDIATQIRATFTPEEKARTLNRAAVDPAAYESYLRGRSLWNQRTEAGLRQAVEQFQRATQIDPNYAEAYSGLADAYTALGYTSYWAPKDSFPKAKEAAQRALSLDPNLAEAHASLGYCKLYYDWDWSGAEQEFKFAIAANPNYATAHHWYSVFLTARSRYPEAEAEIRRASELDPLSVPIATDIGFEQYYARQYDRAISQLRSVLNVSPNFPLAHLWLGRSYEQKGMYAEAVQEFEQTGPLREWPPTLSAAGHAYGLWKRPAEAHRTLQEMERLSSQKHVTPYAFALVCAGLNQKEYAIRWLQRAADERTHWLVWLNTDPRFDNIRTDPGFQRILGTVGFIP